MSNNIAWNIAIWVASLLVMIFSFPASERKISDIIQAQSVVSLVLITWYYAFQTKQQVIEQQNTLLETKKRAHIDFLEKRIIEFYYPFYLLLNEIRDNTFIIRNESDWRISTHRSIYELYGKRSYMTCISPERIDDLCCTLLDIDYKEDGSGRVSHDKLRDIINSIKEYLSKERNQIEKEIVQYYSQVIEAEAGAPEGASEKRRRDGDNE